MEKFFLLTGERYAVPHLDGGEQYIQKIAAKYKLKENEVTETMLMKDLYEGLSSDTETLKNIPWETIDTSRGHKARPNTIDTIIAFLKNLQLNECNTVVFVSRAPYTIGQAESTKKVMYMQSSQRKFEVIGGGASVTEVEPNSAAYHITMAIAGALYGGFERVTMEMNSNYQMCSSIEYLSNYKTDMLSKTYKTKSTRNVKLHDTKIN